MSEVCVCKAAIVRWLPMRLAYEKDVTSPHFLRQPLSEFPLQRSEHSDRKFLIHETFFSGNVKKGIKITERVDYYFYLERQNNVLCNTNPRKLLFSSFDHVAGFV